LYRKAADPRCNFNTIDFLWQAFGGAACSDAAAAGKNEKIIPTALAAAEHLRTFFALAAS
jgi:hypothetical protein